MIDYGKLYDEFLYDCHIANQRLTDEDWLYYGREEHHIEIPDRDGGLLTPLNSQYLTTYQHWVAGVLQSEVLGKCCFACVPKNVLPSTIELLRLKWAAKHANDVNANIPPEQRRENARRANAAKTPEQRSVAVRKANASRTPEQRSDIARRARATLTPEQKTELGIKACAGMTPEQRSERVRKGRSSMTSEQRSEIARKANASRTPEQRRESCLKREAAKRALREQVR